jgi:hypothetical protein
VQVTFTQGATNGGLTPQQNLVAGTPLVFDTIGNNDFGLFGGTGFTGATATFNLGPNPHYYLVNFGFASDSAFGATPMSLQLQLNGAAVSNTQVTAIEGHSLVSTSCIIKTPTGTPNNLLQVIPYPTGNTVDVGLISILIPTYTAAYISIVQIN